MADVKQRKTWLVINETQKTVSVLPTRAMMLEQKAHEETIYNFNKIKTLGLTATFDGTRKTLDAVLSRKFPAYDIDSWSYVSKNPSKSEVAKCKKVLREADSNDLSYIQHIPISAGFDWEKNPTNAGGFPVAIMRLVNEIKESQHGKPEDQLTDFQASYLVPAYRHVFENDRGYIKLTPLGKKLHIVDGELKVRNGETETVKNAGSQYHNIDNFGGGKYVGYANGVWNIRKSGKTWIAERKDDFKRVSGATLKEISERLEKLKNGAAVVNPNYGDYIVVELPNYYGDLILAIENKNHRSVRSEKRGTILFTGTAKECNTFYDAHKKLARYKSSRNGTVKNESASDFKRFTKDRLIELSKMFQGEASGARNRALSPDMLPQETWRLGYLVQMKIRHDGKVNTINFDGESYLAGDLRCNLWAVGKDARIEGIRKPSEGQLKKLGKLIQVDYVTAKKHIEGGKVVRFWHPLGEVNKDYPTLYIDHDGFPIILGGGYDIWNVGIVN